MTLVIQGGGAGDLIIHSPSGVGTTFEGLTDTPGSYVGQGNKLVSVNEAETALEFSDMLYTNLVSMPEDVGGAEAGSTFVDQTVQDMFTTILYPYQEPSFSVFNINGQATILECGVNVTGGTRTFDWTTLNSGNININSLEISDYTLTLDLALALADDDTEIVDIGSSITETVTATIHQWQILGVNNHAEQFTKLFTVTWYSPFYYGVGAPGLTVAQVQGLTKAIVVTGDKTYAFSPSTQVYYFAYPASYGDLTSILDTSNFETIGDWTKRTENFTNNSPDYEGGTVSYNIYEFNNLTTQTNFNNTFIF